MKKKLFASILSAMFLVEFGLPVKVLASEISGFDQTSGTYNIEAVKVSGSTGFRHYDKFNLSQGDIANLKYNNYTKFVNLVNNQVNINGIVNTMKGNNFYNGHAIFVSPNGIVIGASGVLNVGSLSLLTPSQSKFDSFTSAYDSGNLSTYVVGADDYKALITDSHGNIVINGKVLARGDVEMYGDNITIQGTATDKAGIIAGWKDNSKTTFNDLDAAKITFNSLVSNNITDTTNFALENGNVKIVAGFKEKDDNDKPVGASNKAEVLIEDAQIGGNEVEIKANSTREYSITDLADPDDAISSQIDITHSDIIGNNIDILANSEASLSRNINLTVPAVLLWVFDSDAHMDEFFSDGIYDGFEGVRTAATVNITDSILNSTGDLSINTSASSDTNIGSEVGSLPVEVSQFIPAIFYGYGTKTTSQINIKDSSTLKAEGDVDLSAISSNVLKAKIADEVAAGITLKVTDAFNLALMKNSSQADTKITIDHSTVEGENVSAQALAYNEIDNRVILKPRIGRNDFADDRGLNGGSAISLAGLINATDIKSSVEVKNDSVINADEDVTLNAYNINDVSNWVDSEITDPLDYSNAWEEPTNWITKQFKRIGRLATAYDQATTFTPKDFVTKFRQKTENIHNQKHPNWKLKYSEANFEAGAGVIWNDANTSSNVIVDNSKITAGDNINIKAHTVDLTANEVDAYAEEVAKWGGALSLVVNKQTNNNKVDIINSSALTAENDINLDSVLELPAQQGTFGISNKYLTLGMNFGFSANDEWDFGFHDVTSENSSEKVLPEAGIFGFYNNFAVASSAGDKASISAAVIYSDLENNSDINITNSLLTANEGSIIANAVASVSAHDAVDFVNFDGVIDQIIGLAKSEYNKWNHDSGSGAGGSVLVQDFTNNARITVDNSTLKAENGDIELNSAAEQSYLNLITPGGHAETIGITGAVTVQGIHGTTSSTVKNSSNLTANNISIESGKAKAQLTKKGSDMSATGQEFLNDDEDDVELADVRDVKDHITAVAINGTLTNQSEEGGDTTSSGAAFGASVIAQSIDRTVKTSVDNSTLTANKINAKAESYTRDIFITAAGAFAGGVYPEKAAQARANAGNGGANAPQQMGNAGNWMDILDNAQPDDEDVLGLNNLFNENNPNAEGAANAQGQAGNANQLAGGAANPQGGADNFSLALAGSVSVVNDESIVETEINNAVINVGEELNVTADRENFILNISGGLAKSGNVGGGAAVNVYADKGRTVKDADGNALKDENGEDIIIASGAKASIKDSTIAYTSNNAKKLNVTSSNKHTIIEGAVGVGVASNDQDGVKAAVGGSFNTNNLKDTTESKITNTTIKNAEGVTGDIDTKVTATSEDKIWNIGGDLGFARATNNSFGLGAGVAGNMDLLKQTVNAEISGSNSTLTNVSGVEINSKLEQNVNSISIAGAVVNGAKSSFTIDGALGLELVDNTVTALLKDSKISSSGDIKVLTDYDLTGRTLTGSADISNADNSLGVGIGAVVEVDNTTVTSKIDNSKITKSNSIEVKADADDDRKFLAANLGVQSGSGTTVAINANGIVGVLKDTIEAKVLGDSELSSDGDISIISSYDNKNQGITALGAIAKEGGAIGANVIANHYGNEITSEIASTAKILKSWNINVGAKSSEYINSIPVAVALATNKLGSVAADVAVNVIKDKTKAITAGAITTTGNLTVASDGETTIYNRGGTLAMASADAATALGGAINVDYINKEVVAQIGNDTEKTTINAGEKVSTSANSTNSFGGTKNTSGGYDRDDITSSNYQDNLMKKDSDGNYSGIDYNNNFGNWNMFYNLSAGATVAASGSVIVKTIDNTITSEIKNSDITANNMDVIARDYSVKNIIAGQIGASKTAAVGVSVLVTKDDSETSALISNGSDINVTNTLNILSANIKDNNEIVVAANGAKSVAGSVNVLYNSIEDNNTAKIDNSTVKTGELNITANEDMNASRVVVAASGVGKGVAINISPLINKYEGTTSAEIYKSTINDADITLQSDTDIKTRDIAVGVAGAGQGFAAAGLAIKNTYDTNTYAKIYDNSIINTSKNVALNANSVANGENWIVGLSGVGQGIGAVANVIINNIISDVETSISDSTIENAGNITLNTNKDKKDNLGNFAITGTVSGQGVAASSNVFYNIYENNVTSKIYNTSIDNSSLITAQAFSNRKLYNDNLGLSITAEGADLLANALVNEIGTNTLSFVDAKSKTINTSGKLTVKADDNTFAENTMGYGVGVGLGAALGTNINLYYADNLARAEILSNSDGQITAGSADITSNVTNGLDNTNVGVAVGLVGLAGDVVSVKLGKHLNYTDSEKKSGIEDADKKVKNIYESITDSSERKFRTDSSSKLETGAISRVKGNLKSANNINVKAESKLKGKNDSDKLSFTNTQTTVGLGTGSVGIRNIQLNNNTVAEIAGGTVESTNGNISVNAKNTANVDIKNVEVDVSGLKFAGGSAIYNNNSETIAQIGSSDSETTIKSKNNIDVTSNSSSTASIDATNVVVTLGNIVAVDLNENKDNNNSSAIITGKTDVEAEGKLTLHSTANTDLKAEKTVVKIEGANISADITSNEANASTISRAVMENVEGTISANGIDIITDYDKMSVYTKSNITGVKFHDMYSEDTSGSKMNAKFTSGITAENLTINNSGKTTIETAKSTGTNKIIAESETGNVNVSLVGFVARAAAEAENNAESNTYLKAKTHNANSLEINSYLDSKAKAGASSVKVSTVGVNSVGMEAKDNSNLNIDIAGENNIIGSVVINAIHNSDISADLYGFNFSLIGGGQRIRIDADLNSSTTGNLAGSFNANSTTLDFNTQRSSYTNISSGSGGLINVDDSGKSEASNQLRGNSILTVDGLTTDKNIANNNLTIRNTSTNTFDTQSSAGSGGIINVKVDDNYTSLNTSTTTNIKNSNINSNNDVVYQVVNNTIVEDSGSNYGGGVVSVLTSKFDRTYTSGAYLNLESTEIHADNIRLNTLSDISSKRDDYFNYKTGGGGLVAVSSIDIDNKLNQTSQIDLKNSQLYAQEDTELSAKTTSRFKQKSEADSRGLGAAPIIEANLTSTYSNKINLDKDSVISALNNAVFNFDSSNTLASTVKSEAYGLVAPAKGYSYLTLTINNELNNNGKIKAGNLADINYMNNSFNNLKNRVNTLSKASVAKTSEGANLKKIVNNKLIIPENAKIVSNKDIEVSYTGGTDTLDPYMRWDTYSLWFIHDDKTTYPKSISTNNTLSLNGEMIAGQGNSRYMKINQDGSIDESVTKGFSSGDYSLTGGEVLDGATIKENKLSSITIKIEHAEDSLSEVTAQKYNLNAIKTSCEEEKTSAQNIINDFNSLGGYTLVDTEISEGSQISAYDNIIQNDLTSQIVGEGENQITSEQYTAFINKFNDEVKESDSLTITDFLKQDTSLGLSDGQKTTISTAYSGVEERTGNSQNGNFSTYTSLAGTKYAGVQNPTEAGGQKTCAEVTEANTRIAALDMQINEYTSIINSYTETETNLSNEISALKSEKTVIEKTPASEYSVSDDKYAVVFNNLQGQNSHIILDGITNDQNKFTGSGTLSVASQGLQIDNYSTRSLIFNDIDLGSSYDSGLIIGGKNFAKFAGDGTNQAVNSGSAYLYMYLPSLSPSFDDLPKTGAHYITDGAAGISGITVNNFYDIFNPFANSQNITNPTLASDIIFNGSIYTGNDFNVFNDSGSITAGNFNPNRISGAINLAATKGDVNLTSSGSMALKTSDNIFAGNSVNIKANSTDIKGNITAGYNSDLTLTIKDDMLADSNLLIDPVTGEKTLINLGDTPYANSANNVKALYKDGQIYLYNINNVVKGTDQSKRGTVNIISDNNSVTGTIKTYDGYQKIKIDNQTNKQLKISNITNQKSGGGLYINGSKDTAAENIAAADTQVDSKGKITLDGIIRNSVLNSNGGYILDTSADNDSTILKLQANGGGIEIKKQNKYDKNTESIISDAIYAEGKVFLLNESNAEEGAPGAGMDINGDIEVQGDLFVRQDTKGSLNISSYLHQIEHADNSAGFISIQNMNSSAGGVDIADTAYFHNEHGDIQIQNNSTAEVNARGFLYAPKGKVDIINKGNTKQGSIAMAESINILNTSENPTITISNIMVATNGDITVQNNNGDLTITDTARLINQSETAHDINISNIEGGKKLIIAGTVENNSGGDINVTNAGSGDTDITGYIHNRSGNITIDNKTKDLNITGMIAADNGSLTIENNGKNTNIGYMDPENPENNRKATIAVENGDLIINNGTDLNAIEGSIMNIVANITHNYNEDSEGYISIINGPNSAGLNIQSAIKTNGTGKAIGDDIVAIVIDNQSQNENGDLRLRNSEISARKGDILISNSNNTLEIGGGSITNTEAGNIKITNSGTKMLSSAAIENNKGDVVLANNGNGILQFGGHIINNEGNSTITNEGMATELSGFIENYGGNTTVTNKNGLISIAGHLMNVGGDVTVTNEATENSGMNISGDIWNTGGKINISNKDGIFRLEEHADIMNHDDDLIISNSGSNLELKGGVSNSDGSITIVNTGNIANITGDIKTTGGDIEITNSNEGALNIGGNVNVNSINNEIKITNSSTDGMNILKNAIIENMTGNTTVKNNGGDLTIQEGSEIVNDLGGLIDIENTSGKFTIAGTIENTGIDLLGNLGINITNTGNQALEITETGNITSSILTDIGIPSSSADIKITNSNGGGVIVKGNINNENGKIDITNDSIDGMNFVANSVVENVKGNTTVTNNSGDLTVENGATIKNTESGDITVENKGGKSLIAGLLQHLGIGNVTAQNSGNQELEVATTGKIVANNGDIEVTNSNDGALNINGSIENTQGVVNITNTSDDGLMISTTGTVLNKDGNIEISNTGAAGVDVQGSVKTEKQDIVITNKDSDLRIGEYDSNNDNYINAQTGNIKISQTKGNILNNITDSDTSAVHQNYDLANPNHSYKTLLTSGGNLEMNVVNGDIGVTSNSNPGFSVDATTRDYTESININVSGSVIAKAINENNTGKRLVNIRAKDSDLNLKDVTSEGNIILTAADWKQADIRPTPDDEEYFKGYSVLSAGDKDTPVITGQNISVIASDTLGTEDKKLVYMQDTLNAPNSSVSFESENDLYMTGKANSTNETKIYQIISKHGSIDLDFESDAAIKEITANKGLNITQKAQNLTIIDLGMPVSAQGATSPFNDMLNPHDDLVYGIDPVTPENSVIPNYINIKALDAINNPDRADSTIKIYNGYVKGNHGENTQYYENGTRLADVTLMADNIYANSAKAPDSSVSTKANPNGYKQTDKTYTLADFGFTDEDNIVLTSGDSPDIHAVLEAKGINAYGDGEPISLDILGVDKDVVDGLIANPNRNIYVSQKSVSTTPSKFRNANDELTYYDTDYKAKNVAISVNDYVDTNRGVVFDTLYADNAYVNTKDINLDVSNGYITNYAEIRNNDKIAVVDNDFRRIVKPANVQLYTQKTGSFALGLNDTINMKTTAPTVFNNQHMLVNGYHSEWNFVNKGQKEQKDHFENTKMPYDMDKNRYDEPVKRIHERFDTTDDTGLVSDYEIYDISTTGASVKNDKKLKRGKKTTITLKFDDVDITVNAKVVKVNGNKAGLEFIDMPKDVANKILYRYMQKADSMKSNLTSYNE